MKIIKTITICAALSASAPALLATQISGALSFTGVYSVDGTNFNPYDTALNPTGATAFTSFTGVKVASVSGDYTGTVGQDVTHNAFVFDPFTTAITPLWTFTVGTGPSAITYSFDLESLKINYRDTTSIVLAGRGEANITGFDTTDGDWKFTANAGGGTFSFSSTDTVPDGGATAMLMGVGLLGIGLVRRKIS